MKPREPGEWRTFDAQWAVRDAAAPVPGVDATLGIDQARVLLALLLFVNADGKAHPGIARVAKLAGMHPHRVRRVLAELERDAGPLTLAIERERRNRVGEQDTHEYVFGFASDVTSSLQKTPGTRADRRHQASPEDCTTRLQKTAPPVSRRLHHPSPEDDKADLGEDSGEDSSGSRTAAAGNSRTSTTANAPALPHTAGVDITDAFCSPADDAGDAERELEAATYRFKDRVERRRAGDKAWGADMGPGELAVFHLHMLKAVFGDDVAGDEATRVLRAWPQVIEVATARLDEFQGRGPLVADFFAWFATKQSKAKKRPGHNVPGWRLVLGHAGLLDEYKNTLRSKRRKVPAA